jgi:nucleotide sugar dehydrogenase
VNSNFGSGFALVVDSNGRLKGVIEDSDLRKYLSRNREIDLRIDKIMKTDFISVNSNLDDKEILREVLLQINNRGWSTNLPVRIIPVLENGRPINLLDLKEIESTISQMTDRHIVIGLGYVGLTLALSLAHSGRFVLGYDVNNSKIESLNRYDSYISEPGIDKLLRTNLNSRFKISSSSKTFNDDSVLKNIYFICVGTPLDKNKVPDLGHINDCISILLKHLKNGDSLVMRSTVPVGTGRTIIERIEKELSWKVGHNFHYISAPERTVEGNALNEIREIPQLISGATDSCLSVGLGLFQNLSNSVIPLDRIESTELIKIMGNAFRDYIFGFSNYLIDICQEFNLDLNLLIESSNKGYPRSYIPNPSPGVGGPCLTKDSYFISNGLDSSKSSIVAARKVNSMVPRKSVDFIKSKITDLTKYRCLAIGIAFKGVPDTNDFRGSPSLDFIDEIISYVDCVNIWDSVIDTENTELEIGKYKPSINYNFFAILNNNPKNIEFFRLLIKSVDDKEIIIYDPWRLINPNHLILPFRVEVVHYFSLSHYLTIQRQNL